MLSKNQKKLIASMAQKKQRDSHFLFLAEGPKTVTDLLQAGLQPTLIAHTENWFLPSYCNYKSLEINSVTQKELNSASHLKTPQQVLALFKQPQYSINNNAIHNELTLVLDGIQDPGNMGTIVRLADWFGISHIVCSTDTVDIFNPKVVQATMGAIARIKVHYTPLPAFLRQYREKCDNPIYGTYLEGENIYGMSLKSPSLIVMGNEGNGVRKENAPFITHKITIPTFPAGTPKSESLNVGVAAAIVCAEFRRSESYSR
jgi:RNA methyltransferase, TrmH family